MAASVARPDASAGTSGAQGELAGWLLPADRSHGGIATELNESLLLLCLYGQVDGATARAPFKKVPWLKAHQTSLNAINSWTTASVVQKYGSGYGLDVKARWIRAIVSNH